MKRLINLAFVISSLIISSNTIADDNKKSLVKEESNDRSEKPEHEQVAACRNSIGLCRKIP